MKSVSGSEVQTRKGLEEDGISGELLGVASGPGLCGGQTRAQPRGGVRGVWIPGSVSKEDRDKRCLVAGLPHAASRPAPRRRPLPPLPLSRPSLPSLSLSLPGSLSRFLLFTRSIYWPF